MHHFVDFWRPVRSAIIREAREPEISYSYSTLARTKRIIHMSYLINCPIAAVGLSLPLDVLQEGFELQ